jgi:hypothetical protein
MKIAFASILRDSPGHAFMFLPFILALWFTALATPASAQQRSANLKVVDMFASKGQRFFCSVNYPQQQCVRDLMEIRKLLADYHAEELGPWTWILVSSQDWKPLLQRLGLNPSSPAITSFADRQTLLEESLLTPKGGRGSELLLEFHIPLNQLLTLALTHELGHASCRETDERKAEQAAEQIRHGIHPQCDVKLAREVSNVATGNAGR